MNLRPSGYEPDELPGCSIPRQNLTGALRQPGSSFVSRFAERNGGGLLHPASKSYRRLAAARKQFVSRFAERNGGGLLHPAPICSSPLGGQRHVNGFSLFTPATKPGDDLLFHCLGNSTIGAVWFHGRVRDGIGWVTDAMATKLWGRRKRRVKSMRALIRSAASATGAVQ